MRNFLTTAFTLTHTCLAFAADVAPTPLQQVQISDNHALENGYIPVQAAPAAATPEPVAANPRATVVEDPTISWKSDLMWMNF